MALLLMYIIYGKKELKTTIASLIRWVREISFSEQPHFFENINSSIYSRR